VAAYVKTVSVAQLPNELQKLEGKLGNALKRGVRMGLHRGRGIIVRRTPTDLGQLRASWKVKTSELVDELLNDAPHAGIVELGARPHKVSAEGWAAIYEWVRRHPEIYGEKKARSGVKRDKAGTVMSDNLGPFKGADPEISGITWAIVKKINREGQKPTYFVRDSMDLLRKALEAEVERQFARVASRGGGAS
jgi:hypothetical protein